MVEGWVSSVTLSQSIKEVRPRIGARDGGADAVVPDIDLFTDAVPGDEAEGDAAAFARVFDYQIPGAIRFHAEIVIGDIIRFDPVASAINVDACACTAVSIRITDVV